MIIPDQFGNNPFRFVFCPLQMFRYFIQIWRRPMFYRFNFFAPALLINILALWVTHNFGLSLRRQIFGWPCQCIEWLPLLKHCNNCKSCPVSLNCQVSLLVFENIDICILDRKSHLERSEKTKTGHSGTIYTPRGIFLAIPWGHFWHKKIIPRGSQ